MAMTKSYSYRMNSDDHDHAQAVLKSLGLDSTTAIKIFFKQVIAQQGLPFPVRKTNPEISAEMEKDILDSEKEYKKGNYKTFSNVENLLNDLKK